MVTYRIRVRPYGGGYIVRLCRSCDFYPVGEWSCWTVAEGVAAAKHAARYQRRGGLLARVGA